jgi:hypothetical protein
MPLVIVSANDTLSEQKLKMISAVGAKNNDSRLQWSR